MGQLLSARIFSIVRETAGGSFEPEEDTTATRDDNFSGSEQCSSPEGADVRSVLKVTAQSGESSGSKGENVNVWDIRTSRGNGTEYQRGSPIEIFRLNDKAESWYVGEDSTDKTIDGCICFRRKSGSRRPGDFGCFANHAKGDSFCHHARTALRESNDLSIQTNGSAYSISGLKNVCFATADKDLSDVSFQASACQPKSNDRNNNCGLQRFNQSDSVENLEPGQNSPAYSVHWCEMGNVKTNPSNTFIVDVDCSQQDEDVRDTSLCNCPKMWTLVQLPSCLNKAWDSPCHPQCRTNDHRATVGTDWRPICPRVKCGSVSDCANLWRSFSHALCCRDREELAKQQDLEESRMRPDAVVVVDILNGLGVSSSAAETGFVDESSAHISDVGLRAKTGAVQTEPVVIVEQPRKASMGNRNDLLRTGSVQSDSSGFGDADPTPESGHSEGDPPKVSSLGSSHDSGDTTLAGSAGSQQHQKLQQQQHQQKQMATQTPVHSAMFNADETQEEDGSTKERGSPLPGKDHSSFITTCFIPSLNPREPYAPEGLRHRRGGQHPPPPYPYLPQQQQQHYSPLPQQPHFIDLQNARRSSSGFKPEMSFYGQNQTTSRNPSTSGSYYSGYEYPPMQHPADFPPHHPRHSSYQPYRYDVYDDSGSSYYTRGFPHSKSYRSAMSDSEWSGYTDRDYFNQSYFYDYKYNHPPPSPPQHRRFFAHRPRSLDHPSDYMDYASDPNRDGFLSSDKEDLPPPRRYRSQLELYTTGTGRVGSQPNADPRKQQQQKSFSRGQSEDSVLDSTGVTEGEEIIAGSGRNQMPLSEELAKAMGGKTVSNHTPVPLPSSAESSPSKAQPSVSSSSFISSVTVTPGRDSHSNKRNVVSNIFIPNASSVTLTPATSDISKHESVVSVSAAPTDLSHIISAAPGSPAQESSHINGQNLPALAGNLRSLPQVLHSTDFNGHNHRTTITIATSSLSSSPMPITQSSNPVASAAVTSSSLIETPAKVKSSFSSASASAFRSRQPKSCDILDDDDENSFLDGEALSGVERGKNPQTSSASYISQIYHETKRGVGTGHRQKEGIFTSQLPYQYPGSPSLRHRHPGPPPSPSRPYGYSPYHGHHPPHPRPHSSSSSSLPPMPLPARHPLSFSQCSDEMEGYYSSSMAESSSDFSFRSTPEWGGRAGILNARKLARLINQPVYFKGSRRPGCSYRPRRLFKEWTMLSKRKRLQEENRLLQHTLHRYKTELQLMETVVKVDYQAALPDMTDEEREQLASLEWLWSEIKGQVAEMEQLLLSRIKSVQSGNDFHTLLANMGIINKMTELIKEQIYHQKLISSRGAAADDEDEEDNDSFIEGQDQDFEFEEDTPDELQMFDEYDFDGGVRHGDHVWSWIAGVGTASTPRYRSQGKTGSSDNFGSTSSTSNLPNDLNASLEQIKTSLLSQVQQEIKDSTRKLELNLQAKDKEIQELKNQIGTRSAMSTPDLTYRSVARIGTGARPRSATPQGHNPLRKRSHSRSRMMGDRIVQETDV
ncbi:hypothetical protein PoB_004491500 [Plakobranchus ocellatus]|uniref:Uncharacterized protein n=1 Tax=Plakobranchus ocellatus TaxID=259542 RepID=A0AAV4BFU6_9GAST|nr:hypothetical protein PoB_004491500 [Plakobranchus ocellatus]